MDLRKLVVAGSLLALLPFAALAAEDDQHEGESDQNAPAPSVRTAERFAEWKAKHGPSWHHAFEERTGFAEMLYGGKVAPAFEPRSDADFFGLAQLLVEDTMPITGIESATLLPERVRFLPLGLIGTTDKIAVRFHQSVAGVPVLGATVNVLFDVDGNALALQSTALPEVLALRTSSSLTGARAASRALELFVRQTGLSGDLTAEPLLAIAPLEVGGLLSPTLVWEVDVQWSEPDFEPEGWTYWIDAGDGRELQRRSSIHHFDVGGTVQSRATPGTFPDSGSNPPVAMPVPHARITSSAGTIHTDADGNFNYPGITGPLQVTVEYRGLFARVDNFSGSNHVLTQSITGTGNTLLMNSGGTGTVTSQANAMIQLGVLRDWIRSINPSDSTADFMAQAYVNRSNLTCNAYFDGGSVNFMIPSGSCPNTAFSTVVAHEMGHWLNVLYGTGNGSDGMGEGNADIYAMYLYDTPIVGQNFFGNGTFIRTGENVRQFCGDCCPGCHPGGVHGNGEVWMGAAWKIRTHLKATHGSAMGGAIADGLFSGWMNTYNQTQIRSIIEIQWLTLDDDDGNIDNGTPHYADIDQGFRDQGFPGFDLAAVSFSNVTQLADTLDETGPYVVDATIKPEFAPPIMSAQIFYRANGGAWSSTPMSNVGGNEWTGAIPGHPSISTVEYYLQAVDDNGNDGVFPSGAPDATLRFHVGKFVLYFNDFEAVSDEGWTHASFGDTSNNHDDFQHGPVFGKAGDPNSAYSGTRLWGNDLGPTGWNGAYQANQHNWLRSPIIDASGAEGTTLKFARWLTVEQSGADQARIRVNGTEVFINEPGQNLIDTSWKIIEIDISHVADGQSQVQIEWSLKSNGSNHFGGWNIDDVEVYWIPTCPSPATYGQAKTNSLGIEAQMGWQGTPSLGAGNFAVTLVGGIPSQPALLFSGDAPDNTPFFGGFRLVAPPITRELTYSLDMFGDSVVPISITAAMVGTTKYYQTWYRDPADPAGFGVGLSDGLRATYCD